MVISTNQIILAAAVGIAGVTAAFMPIIALTTTFLTKDKGAQDDTSIWHFAFMVTITQFMVSLFFYWAIVILNSLNKFGGMGILGPGGAFDLFWKVTASGGETNAWIGVILLVRSIVTTLNAFIPFVVVLGGGIVGYNIAQVGARGRGADKGTGDFLGYGVRVFIGVIIAAIAYVAWAKMASYTMMMPSTASGEPTMLIDAAQQWWRDGLGVKLSGAKPPSTL